MSGPIPAMPIGEVRALVASHIEYLKQNSFDPVQVRAFLSINEYLKDAERWRFVERYEIPQGMSPRETRKWVDDQMKEIEDGVERVIRARERWSDGVPGDSGAGGTPDLVV